MMQIGTVSVDSFGTGVLTDQKLAAIAAKVFDFSPAGIIEDLDLRRPIYAKTAVGGHFGRQDPDFTWENLDRVDQLKAFLPRKTSRGSKTARPVRKPARRKGGK